MRLSPQQRQQVLQETVHTRPGAQLVRPRGCNTWIAVWHVKVDALVDSEATVPARLRWRAQAVNGVNAYGTWWCGFEAQAPTRKQAIAAVVADLGVA